MKAAIIDIGSGSVGLAMVLIEKGNLPTIQFMARQELRAELNIDPERLIRDSRTALLKVVNDMQRGGLGAPTKIFCFLSPHLIISQTRIISLKFNKPTAVSQKIIDKMVDSEIGKLPPGMLIDRKIIRVKLNGYEVGTLNGKVASEVELTVLFTLANEALIRNMKREIAGHFHNDSVEFHSFSVAYFDLVRASLSKKDNFVIIDAGSEVTDICLIQDGIFKNSITVPIGKSRKANIWPSEVSKILGQIAIPGKLPETIFILADKDILPFFKQALTSQTLADLTLANKEPTVVGLTSADFYNFCNNRSRQADDPFLMIASIFVNKLLN